MLEVTTQQFTYNKWAVLCLFFVSLVISHPLESQWAKAVTRRWPLASPNCPAATQGSPGAWSLRVVTSDPSPEFSLWAARTFKLFCDSFLAYIYNLSSWRDYSCINLNPEKRHSLPRVISWLTTLEGSNHFLKRIRGLFMRAQQTDRHFLCFVKLHCTNSPLFLWSPSVTMNSLFVLCCPFFHVQFSVPDMGFMSRQFFFP